MSARIFKQGSSDYGYWVIRCDSKECADRTGQPWQHSHSRRTVEGYDLAVRDRDEHNRAKHAE